MDQTPIAPDTRKPPWLKKRLPDPVVLNRMRGMLDGLGLHTICQSGACPNIGECWANGNATFMILGDVCTRSCGFCKVTTGRPFSEPSPLEPARVAQAVKVLGLQHVVITSVTRDDLKDGGARHFALTIQEVRRRAPKATIEVLIPDFKGDEACLRTVTEARPDILAHNLETVRRLQRPVRRQAKFERSLEVLRRAKEMDPHGLTKSSLMVGLGEQREEMIDALQALRSVDCDLVTIGQYLRPSAEHLAVEEFVHPDRFEEYKQLGEAMGFLHVASGPFVRSSYNAGVTLREVARRRGLPGWEARVGESYLLPEEESSATAHSGMIASQS